MLEVEIAHDFIDVTTTGADEFDNFRRVGHDESRQLGKAPLSTEVNVLSGMSTLWMEKVRRGVRSAPDRR